MDQPHALGAQVADAELLEVIRDIYRRSRNTYGVPRLRAAPPQRPTRREVALRG
ncbi:MAG: hypothetical protein R2749_06495 [Acidimicrobiales bacterium]